MPDLLDLLRGAVAVLGFALLVSGYVLASRIRRAR